MWVDPVSSSYRGYDVWEMPPNSSGIVALMMSDPWTRTDEAFVSHRYPATNPVYTYVVEFDTLRYGLWCGFGAVLIFVRCGLRTVLLPSWCGVAAQHASISKQSELCVD